MAYDDDIRKIDTNELRVNLTKYLTENLGDTIFITRYNRLVAELRVYTEDTRRKTELRIAEMVKNNLYFYGYEDHRIAQHFSRNVCAILFSTA
jgi:hypothetical protein